MTLLCLDGRWPCSAWMAGAGALHICRLSTLRYEANANVAVLLLQMYLVVALVSPKIARAPLHDSFCHSTC